MGVALRGTASRQKQAFSMYSGVGGLTFLSGQLCSVAVSQGVALAVAACRTRMIYFAVQVRQNKSNGRLRGFLPLFAGFLTARVWDS